MGTWFAFHNLFTLSVLTGIMILYRFVQMASRILSLVVKVVCWWQYYFQTNNLSVYATELSVILLLLVWVKSTNINLKHFIFSDSFNSLQSLVSEVPERQDLLNKIFVIHNEIRVLGHKTVLEWTLAHIGIPGNGAMGRNKGRGMYYPVCGMVHIKEPLLLIDKSSLCGGSGFPFSLSERSLTICLTPYNRR